MISENGRAFGELSIQKSRENREFTRNMVLHGEKITIPVRSGTSEAILYPAAGEGPAPTIFAGRTNSFASSGESSVK